MGKTVVSRMNNPAQEPKGLKMYSLDLQVNPIDEWGYGHRGVISPT
jgi:hypothetical protein